MTTDDLTLVLAALAISAVLLYANLKAGPTWLKFTTITGFLGFVALAGFITVTAALR